MSLHCLYFAFNVASKYTKAPMKIKASVLKRISEHKGLRARLCEEMNKSYFTVNRWINENDDNLTKATALKIIRDELGLSDAQILEESKSAA